MIIRASKKLLSVSVLSLVVILSGCAINNQEASNSKTLKAEADVVDLTRNRNYKKAIEINSQLAIIYSQKKMLDRAKTKIIKAKELEDKYDYDLAIVDYANGYYYQSLGIDSLANKNYLEALDNEPDNYEALNFYGQFLCLTSHYEKAKEIFTKSLFLSTNSDMSQTLFLYGQCLDLQGKSKQAIQTLIKSTQFGDSSPYARYSLAQIYNKEKNYKKAYFALNTIANEEFKKSLNYLKLKLDLEEKLKMKDKIASTMLLISSSEHQNKQLSDEIFVPKILKLDDTNG